MVTVLYDVATPIVVRNTVVLLLRFILARVWYIDTSLDDPIIDEYHRTAKPSAKFLSMGLQDRNIVATTLLVSA